MREYGERNGKLYFFRIGYRTDELYDCFHEGEIMESLNPNDNCGAPAGSGELCGGCDGCLLMQSFHYGAKMASRTYNPRTQVMTFRDYGYRVSK